MMTTERYVDGVSGTEATLYRTGEAREGGSARGRGPPRGHMRPRRRGRVQGQATAEDEPRRRPRGAARPSYIISVNEGYEAEC